MCDQQRKIYEDIPAGGSAGFCVEECGFNSWLCAKLMTCCNGSDFFSLVDALADLELISKFDEVLCGKLYYFAAFWNGSFGISTNLSISPPGGGSILGFEASTSFPAQVVGVKTPRQAAVAGHRKMMRRSDSERPLSFVTIVIIIMESSLLLWSFTYAPCLKWLQAILCCTLFHQ